MSDETKNVNASIPILFEKIEDVDSDSGVFTKVKCWLMHTGKNLNNSIFDKNVIEDAITSLQYIPIVAFVNADGDVDFEGHEYILTKDENGIRYKYIGSAYGVILSTEDNEAHFEMKMCDDGVEREFLVVDGVLWNQFEDAVDIFNRDGVKGHSIELDPNSIEGYEDDDGCFVFTKFSFRAACALGEDKVPAMTGSCIEVNFTMSDFVKNLQSEINDKYTVFTELMNDKKVRGGVENMSNTDFAQTVMEQFDDIKAIVGQHESIRDHWGDKVPRYYLVDVQEDEAIVVDRAESYRNYGFKFTVDGDAPKIDFESKRRKKVRYEDYEDGASAPAGSFSLGEYVESVEESAAEKVAAAESELTELKTEYEAVKSELEDIKPKYEDYVAAEEARQAEAVNAEKDAKFAEYEDVLGENADFAALKENKDSMSVDEIEKECAVLYVKESRGKTNFSVNGGSAAVVGVIGDDDDDAVDGYVSTRYGLIKKNH